MGRWKVLPLGTFIVTQMRSEVHLMLIVFSSTRFCDSNSVNLQTAIFFCQLAPCFRQLISSHKTKNRVSRQPAEGCQNARKCFISSHFSLFTSVPLTANIPSQHEILRLYVNIATSIKISRFYICLSTILSTLLGGFMIRLFCNIIRLFVALTFFNTSQ